MLILAVGSVGQHKSLTTSTLGDIGKSSLKKDLFGNERFYRYILKRMAFTAKGDSFGGQLTAFICLHLVEPLRRNLEHAQVFVQPSRAACGPRTQYLPKKCVSLTGIFSARCLS